MHDEGYVKFRCHWIMADPIAPELIRELNGWRNRLYQIGLIGAYRNGIGFGNISVRIEGTKQFIISGTQTGAIVTLDEKHYTVVLDFDLKQNELTCKGPVKASSESFAHGVIYQISSDVGAIIHVHSGDLWRRFLNQAPTTSKKVSYGTPEMAEEIKKLFTETDLASQKILVMGGHEEGVITFGENLEDAASVLIRHFQDTDK